MANTIFRGPIEHQPRTINLPVAGAYLPGIIVTEDGTNLTMATGADDENEMFVLGNVDFKDQDIATAYTSGDTGVAFEMLPGLIFQARLAAGTYAKGDALSIGASGRLEAAATGEVVVARFEGTPGAKSAGDLDDVKIANAFKSA